ncbi:MAG: M23 family metallopeptidase, partial [Elusimicrobiales bacterium]
MKLVRICLLSLVGLLPNCAFTQILPWPDTPAGVPYRLESSYGPRKSNGTFFHKGLDFNEQGTSSSDGTGEKEKDYPIITPASGTIFGIGSSGSLKWIGIDYGNNRKLAYLHIFSTNDFAPFGNFKGSISNPIGSDGEIRSYRRSYTASNEDYGLILFYSGQVVLNNNTGRIVKVLGISTIHARRVKVSNGDFQNIAVSTATHPENSVVVSPSTDAVLETMPFGDDVYSDDKLSILVGPNRRAETTAGYVTVSTTVLAGEIIAPVGRSGTDNTHLHIQISSSDYKLNNTKSGNDGWDNPIQYLERGNSAFSGKISTPTINSLIYHTASHNYERVTANIRQRLTAYDASWETYHNYELDRVRFFAISKALMAATTDYVALLAGNNNTINSDRDVTLTDRFSPPNPIDPFRAEFNYGGSRNTSDNAFPPFLNNPSASNEEGALLKTDGYKTGVRAKDDLSINPTTEFVFNQWNTRINKDFSGLAYRSQDAAYPDGEYALLAVAESVDRDPAEMFVSSVSVGIDNFRPYLEEVRVFAENLPGTPVVRRHAWLLENNLLVSSEPLKNWLVPGEYTLSATFSEEMNGDYISLGLEGKGALANTDVFYSTEARKTIASGRLSISPAEYPQDALVRVVAGGTDIAAKELLAVSTDTTTIDPAKKLTRDAFGDMQGEGGQDNSTELRIEVSSPVISWFAGGGYHSCPGECGSQAEPLIFTSNGTWLDFSDLGAGL